MPTLSLSCLPMLQSLERIGILLGLSSLIRLALIQAFKELFFLFLFLFKEVIDGIFCF